MTQLDRSFYPVDSLRDGPGVTGKQERDPVKENHNTFELSLRIESPIILETKKLTNGKGRI